jgi:hypothetical protein
MKKILFAVFALLIILPTSADCQKERVAFDTATKKLTILTEIEIDTAFLYAQKAKAQAKKQKLVEALAAVNIQLDTFNSQIRVARKLMTGKKGGGNNRKADTPTPQPIEKPKTTKPKTTKKTKQ